ncbi:MAG: hypothetical protein RR060_01355 [Victivallaceae bacterium]
MSFRFGLRFVFWSAVIYTSLSLATTLFGLIFQDSLFIDILAILNIFAVQGLLKQSNFWRKYLIFWSLGSAFTYLLLGLAVIFGVGKIRTSIDIPLAQLKIWLPLICAFWIADLVICAYFLLNPQLVKQYRRMRSLREIASQN